MKKIKNDVENVEFVKEFLEYFISTFNSYIDCSEGQISEINSILSSASRLYLTNKGELVIEEGRFCLNGFYLMDVSKQYNNFKYIKRDKKLTGLGI